MPFFQWFRKLVSPENSKKKKKIITEIQNLYLRMGWNKTLLRAFLLKMFPTKIFCNMKSFMESFKNVPKLLLKNLSATPKKLGSLCNKDAVENNPVGRGKRKAKCSENYISMQIYSGNFKLLPYLRVYRLKSTSFLK